MPRLTNDIDIVIELEGVDIAEFCGQLSSVFYVDRDAVTMAQRAGVRSIWAVPSSSTSFRSQAMSFCDQN